MNLINLIYIGNKFYMESDTVMSSLYNEQGLRYDWGFVQRDLKEGKTVVIRPAYSHELDRAEKMLKEIKETKEK